MWHISISNSSWRATRYGMTYARLASHTNHDQELAQIKSDYNSGKLLTGEVRAFAHGLPRRC